MAEEILDHSALAPSEEADLLQYGAISPMAVGALLLGLLSCLALSQLLLLIVPLIAVHTSLLALRQIARSQGALVGRSAAIAGLALALVFASLALAQSTTRSWKLHAEAKSFGEAWLVMVRDGQLQRAHQLHLAARDRQLPSSSLSQFYASNEEARDNLQKFFSDSPLAEVAATPAHSECYFQSAETNNYDDITHVLMRYELSPAGEASSPLEFVLVVERAPTDAGGVWRAVAVTAVKDDATR